MAGFFDDLIPSAPAPQVNSDPFADLIPSAPAPAASAPQAAPLPVPRTVDTRNAAPAPLAAPLPVPRGSGLDAASDTGGGSILDSAGLTGWGWKAGPSGGYGGAAPRTPENDPFAGESMTDLAKRRGQQFAEGVAAVPASVPQAIAISEAGFDRAVVGQAPEQVQKQAMAADSLKTILDKGVSPTGGGPLSADERAMYQKRYDEAVLGVETWADRADVQVRPAEQRGLYKAGQSIVDWTDKTFGKPPPDDSFWGQFAQGAGSYVGFAIPAILTGAAGLPVTAALGVSANATSVYQDAKAKGATDAQAEAAAKINGIVGLSEVVPIGHALHLLPPSIRGRITSQFLKKLGDVAVNAGEEGLQEFAQQVAQNVTGIMQGYDPNRGVLDGAGQSALIGAMLGGGVSTVTNIAEGPPAKQAGRAALANLETPAADARVNEYLRNRAETEYRDRMRPDSPRLTADDRASAIPNDIIDDGKAQIDALLSGQPVPQKAPEAPQPGPDLAPPPAEPAPAAAQTPQLSEPIDEIGADGNPTGRQVRIDLATGRAQVVAPEAPTSDQGEKIDTGAQQPDPFTDLVPQAQQDVQTPAGVPDLDSNVPAEAAPHPKPTDGQKDAGNYKMAHLPWNGLNLTIETAKGQDRTGTDADGEKWSVTMPADYGYIKGTEGKDGDQVDVYVGPDAASNQVVVVNQVDAKTGKFDETKSILGASTPEQALALYRGGFSDGKADQRIGSYSVMTVDQFKDWVKNGDHRKPTSEITMPFAGREAGAETAVETAKLPMVAAKKPGAEVRPESLLRFISEEGGVQDMAGELASMNAELWHRQPRAKGERGFRKKLVKENGRTISKMAERAYEAGYIPNKEDNTLLDAIRAELGGQRVTSQQDQQAEQRFQAQQAEKDAGDLEAQTRDAITAHLDEEWDGMMLSQAEIAQAAVDVMNGADMDSAIERVIGSAVESAKAQINGQPAEEIPFPDVAARGPAQRSGETGGRPAPSEAGAQPDAGVRQGDQRPAPQPEGVAKPFDAKAWDAERNQRIKESRAAGNTHLDKIEPAVETMRGLSIQYVHDPKVRGTIRTVDNNKSVLVYWSDAYSAEQEMAQETTEGRKTVWQSWLVPSDLKDYRVVTKATPRPSTDSGPDGGTQTVIPGAERITDKELAQRRMEGPKKATKEQKAPGEDGGLFDTGARKQEDMFDQGPKAKAEAPAPAGPRVTALGIADKIKAVGSQAILGQKVDSAEKLAEVAQVFRDPRYETFRMFLVKDGVVIHATGISARMPGHVPMVPQGMTQDQFFDVFRSNMKRTGADGYYIIHNHPSGNPSPSPMDVSTTKNIASKVPGMLGHVVINSNRFATIGPDGKTEIVERDFGADKMLQASKPSPLIGAALKGHADAAEIAKKTQKPGYISALGRASDGSLRAIAEIPVSFLEKSDLRLKGAVRRFMRMSGSSQVILVGPTDAVHSDVVRRAVESGLILDGIDSDGKSAVSTFGLMPGRGFKSIGRETSRGEVAPPKPAPAPAAPTKIEDFGEKIAGAAKDRWREYAAKLEEVSDAEIVSEPLSKVFPAPDYQALLDEGSDPWTVAFVRSARDMIPTKPKASWKLRGWVEQVAALRKFAKDLLSGETDKARVQALLSEPKFANLNYALSGITDLYLAVGHGTSLKGIRFGESKYSVYNGEYFKQPKVIWEVTQKAKASIFSNMPRVIAKGDTREEAIAAFKKRIEGGLEPTKTTKGPTRFFIYSKRTEDPRRWYIGRKMGRDYVDLESFADVAEARKYLDENQKALEAKWSKMTDVRERRDTNEPRVGADHRDGGDVTPQQFSEAFGFRGVQFGNYVEGPRRQQDLNRAYDGLMDLAGVIGVDPKALSLNGELALAFGARGRGGNNPAAAHYEPGQIVINLTKANGAGSLAHEWFHAIDNYFERMRGRPSRYITDMPRSMADGEVRPEVLQAIAEIRQAINKTRLPQRSGKLDRYRSKPYWGTGIEMHARAFEAYVIAKLQDGGYANDYLANIVDEKMFEAESSIAGREPGMYPYPTADEMADIRAAFDNLFQTIETKQTDKGVAMFARDTAGDVGEVDWVNLGQQSVGYSTSPEMQGAVQAIQRDLQKDLDRMNFPGVAVKVSERLFGKEGNWVGEADGHAANGIISLALNPQRGRRVTLHHEAVHVARDAALWGKPNGLFKDTEWRALVREAMSDPARVAEINDVYADLSEDKRQEEMVAALMEDWYAGRFTPKGFVRDALERFQRFIEAIGNALRGNGFTSADQVLNRLASGEVGKRAAGASTLRSEPRSGARASNTAPIFYSPLLRALDGAKQKSATGNDWKAIISKLPGVKKVEIEWLGVNDWLDAQTGQVPREAVSQFIADNQVRIETDVLAGQDEDAGTDYRVETGDAVIPDDEFFKDEAKIYVDDARDELDDDATEDEIMERAEELARENYEPTEFHATLSDWMGDGADYDGYFDSDAGVYYFPDLIDEHLSSDGAIEEATSQADAEYRKASEAEGIAGPAQHETYTEPGGENYREILLRVPDLNTTGPNAQKFEVGPDGIGREVKAAKRPFVQPSHFDQPNIVVHARVKDRTDADGKKVLFVEEIQSDLASKWREQGEPPEVTQRRIEVRQQTSDLLAQSRAAYKAFTADLVKKAGPQMYGGTSQWDDWAKSYGRDVADRLLGRSAYASSDYIVAVAKKVRDDAETMALAKDYLEKDDAYRVASAEMLRLGTAKTMDPTTPDTPFKEEATYKLMVKRLLREAAEKGYDKLAWTPGYMQAERWNQAAQNVVEGINWTTAENGNKPVTLEMAGGDPMMVIATPEGNVQASGRPEIDGQPLASLVGPGLAKQILSEKSGKESNTKITFPSSGYAIAYDQQTRKAVNDFAKKFGGRVVEDRTLGDMADSLRREDARVEAIREMGFDAALERARSVLYGDRINDTARARHDASLRATQGGPSWAENFEMVARSIDYRKVDQAFPSKPIAKPVWSIEITPEMRESAIRSQPMFARRPQPLFPPNNDITIPDRRIGEELFATNRGIFENIGQAGGAAYDMVDRVRFYLQDRFLPVLRAQEAVVRATGQQIPERMNAYLAEETYHGKVGRRLFEIDEEFTKPIIGLIAGGEDMTVDDVDAWLYARHAQERNQRIADINPKMPDGGSGMTNAEAQQILDDAANGPNAQRYQQIGSLVDRLREKSVDLREEAGLLNAQDAAVWRAMYQHYVPLKGWADSEAGPPMLPSGIGRKFNVQGKESRRALGRQSRAFSPLQGILTQSQEAAIRAEKARVGKAFYELVAANPSPMWEIKTPEQKRYFNSTTGLVETRVAPVTEGRLEPNEFAVKIDGRERRIVIHDERLAHAMGSMATEQVSAILRAGMAFSRYFSSINTMLNPEFLISNALRDLGTAQVNIRSFGEAERNKMAKAMLKNWGRAFRAAYRGQLNIADDQWTKHYREYEESGAKVSFWTMEMPAEARSDFQKRLAVAKGGRLKKAAQLLKANTRDNPVLAYIERVNLAVDNAIRLAAYVEARNAGWSKQQAASLSKNLTVNFNRKGKLGPALNAFYPFFNAALQGSQVLLRAATSRRVQKVMAGLIAAGFLQDWANALLSADDDDGEKAWDKVPDWRQRRYFMMMFPDSENPVSIPLPYGYNLFPYMGSQLSKVARGVKAPGDALGDFLGAAFDAFSPITGQTVQQVVTPTVLEPVVELTFNKDWQGRNIRPENPYGDYGPQAYKFYPSVSEGSRVASDVLNRLSGGNRTEAGLVDVSPEYLDYLGGFATGGAGRFAGRVSDIASKIVFGNLDDLNLGQVPFARQLYFETGDWLDRNRYYDFRTEVLNARESVKISQKTGEPVSRETQDLASLYGPLKIAEKVVRNTRSQINAINGDETMTDKQRRDLKDPVYEAQTKAMIRFNGLFVKKLGPQGE